MVFNQTERLTAQKELMKIWLWLKVRPTSSAPLHRYCKHFASWRQKVPICFLTLFPVWSWRGRKGKWWGSRRRPGKESAVHDILRHLRVYSCPTGQVPLRPLVSLHFLLWPSALSYVEPRDGEAKPRKPQVWATAVPKDWWLEEVTGSWSSSFLKSNVFLITVGNEETSEK